MKKIIILYLLSLPLFCFAQTIPLNIQGQINVDLKEFTKYNDLQINNCSIHIENVNVGQLNNSTKVIKIKNNISINCPNDVNYSLSVNNQNIEWLSERKLRFNSNYIPYIIQATCEYCNPKHGNSIYTFETTLNNNYLPSEYGIYQDTIFFNFKIEK